MILMLHLSYLFYCKS